MSENIKRSLLKTFSWRVTGSSATFFIAWIIGGDWTLASTIAVVQIMVNTVLYYVHERVWNFATWGRINILAKETDQ